MAGEIRILLVEDNSSTALIYENYLSDDYRVSVVGTGEEALELFQQAEYHACIIDIGLPDMTGIELMQLMRPIRPHTPIIVATSSERAEDVVDAINTGANDYLSKPIDRTRLCVTVANCVKEYRLNRLVSAFNLEAERLTFNNMIGESAVMQNLFASIIPAAKSNAPVFITGESGTGKELCAEAVHRESNRSKGEFVALNCAAIPHDLLESEIFGHVKGAFTGAISDRKGAAEAAHNGTLFLDEIGELPVDLQSKILRFVQTLEVTPVGSNKPIKVDVRLVCATNRDPIKEIQCGSFREDLFYRLNVIPVNMPPLRDRGDDIVMLARHFLARYAREESKKFKRFSGSAELVLKTYRWPGNVRQLQNTIQQIVIMHDSEEVSATMLPESIIKNYHSTIEATANEVKAFPVEMNYGSGPVRPLWQVEKQAIEQALRVTQNNISEAAELLAVSPSTIYRKVAKWASKD